MLRLIEICTFPSKVDTQLDRFRKDCIKLIKDSLIFHEYILSDDENISINLKVQGEKAKRQKRFKKVLMTITPHILKNNFRVKERD